MGKEHEALKETARKILKDMGFQDNEIQEEFSVGQNSLKTFRVDVVGLNNQKKVAIECGNTPGEKIAALKMFFDEVIVLPYFAINTDQNLYNKRIRELETQVTHLNEIIEEKKQELVQARDEVNDKTSIVRTLLDVTGKMFEGTLELSTRYLLGVNVDYENSRETNTDLINNLQVRLNAKLDDAKKKLNETNSNAVNFL